MLLTAAGVGARLRPITDTLPKCLVPIGGRPLLEYWFDAFERAGIRHVLINTHHLPERVREYIAKKNATGKYEVVETYEPQLLGSAGTITANEGFVPRCGAGRDAQPTKVSGEEVLIIYSDNLSNIDLGKFLEYHRSHEDPFTMLLFRAQFPEKSGIAELEVGCGASFGESGMAGGSSRAGTPVVPKASRAGTPVVPNAFAGAMCGKVVRFVEKPKQPKSDLANAGLYAMSRSLWHEIAGWKAFDIGFDVLPKLVGRMHAIEHGAALATGLAAGGREGYHRDIGTHESLGIAEGDVKRVFG